MGHGGIFLHWLWPPFARQWGSHDTSHDDPNTIHGHVMSNALRAVTVSELMQKPIALPQISYAPPPKERRPRTVSVSLIKHQRTPGVRGCVGGGDTKGSSAMRSLICGGGHAMRWEQRNAHPQYETAIVQRRRLL